MKIRTELAPEPKMVLEGTPEEMKRLSGVLIYVYALPADQHGKNAHAQHVMDLIEAGLGDLRCAASAEADNA